MKHYYDILHTEEEYTIISKQPGVDTTLATLRAAIHLEKELYNRTKKNYKVMFPMDYLTSGALIVSTSEEALTKLRQDMDNSHFTFTYDIIVKLPLFLNKERLNFRYEKKNYGKLAIKENGYPFSMDLKLIKEYKDYAHLKVITKTPLDHAVRLGVSFLGSPIAADTVYGLKEPVLLSQMKRYRYKALKEQKETPIIQRPAIHLSHISYKDKGWDAPLTKDIFSLFCKLEKYNRPVEESYFQDILEHLNQ